MEGHSDKSCLLGIDARQSICRFVKNNLSFVDSSRNFSINVLFFYFPELVLLVREAACIYLTKQDKAVSGAFFSPSRLI